MYNIIILTHVILLRLSCEGCTLVVLNSHTSSSSDVIVVKVTSPCHVASQHVQEHLGALFKTFNGEQEK